MGIVDVVLWQQWLKKILNVSGDTDGLWENGKNVIVSMCVTFSLVKLEV